MTIFAVTTIWIALAVIWIAALELSANYRLGMWRHALRAKRIRRLRRDLDEAALIEWAHHLRETVIA